MKPILTFLLLLFVSNFVVFAQNATDEQEILKIHNSLDTAFLKQDITAFERAFADDYVMSGMSGKMMNRAETLADLKKEWTEAKYKIVSSTFDNVKVRVAGDMAFTTGGWTMRTTPKTGASGETHTDTGRFTGIYERRNGGKWMLVAEHWSEAQHDRKAMEEQVLKAGLEYGRIIKTQDAAAIERLLADEYLYTNESGKVETKAEEVASYRTPAKFEIFDISDQKVRIIGNNAAVETGTVRYKGMTHDGKPFDSSERYTTTWVWRDGRWQVVADHTSEIKK